MDLKVQFDGLELKNPLMPASGPLVGDTEKLRFMREEADVGAVVTKTISQKGAKVPKPAIYGGKDFVQNSELWSEYPIEKWIEDFLPAYKKDNDRPLIISVGYTKEDMEALIPKLDPFADAFEISTHYVGTDLSVIGETVKTIRRHTEKPVYMKISPHLPDVEGYAETIKKAGADGVVAINSLGPTLNIDIAKRRIVYGGEDGFVWTSGPVIKNLALATVRKLKTAAPDLTVIGVGGIAGAKDVIEFLLAGADAVQMLSAALLKGKQLYKKIIDDLPSTLEKYGFTSIADVKRTTLDQSVSYADDVPRLIEEKCIECMLCKKVCPYFAITFEERITFDSDTCTSCGLCVSVCPTDAIKMERLG